uniref:U6 snRNA-associated Sm-like protein LSm4 n=1 Tax=Ditylenchus dipsaci TaxID=166011 RepID=A0A915DEJ4_9BILA
MSGFIFLFVFVVAGVKLFEQCKVAITYFSNLLNMTSLRHLSKELVKNCIQNNVNRFKDFELGIQEIHRFPKSKFFGCHTNFEGWLLFPEDPIGLIINYLRIPDEITLFHRFDIAHYRNYGVATFVAKNCPEPPHVN